MNPKSIVIALAAALALAPFAAQADGAEPAGGVRLQRGGDHASSPQIRATKEHGVTVWRPAPSLVSRLAGAPQTAPRAKPPVETVRKVVVVHHYRSRMQYLRTQGFYSGHPGKSRRFTQGFYSGPVDYGREGY